MTTRNSQIPWLDEQRLLRETVVRGMHAFRELESTNSYALSSCQSLPSVPHLVIADMQTRGRGRNDNRWWAEAGSLTFSLVIERHQWGIAEEHIPLLSLATGLAVVRSIAVLLEDSQERSATELGVRYEAQLKWPNDIYVDDRKLGGILIEAVPGCTQRFVVGIGLNLNNSLASAPDDVQIRAISLTDVCNVEISRLDTLIELLHQLDQCYLQLGRNAAAIVAACRAYDWLRGRMVRVVNPAETVQGYCVGMSDAGALVVETQTGPREFISGTIDISSSCVS